MVWVDIDDTWAPTAPWFSLAPHVGCNDDVKCDDLVCTVKLEMCKLPNIVESGHRQLAARKVVGGAIGRFGICDSL